MNLNSNNEINSLKLISKIKERPDSEEEEAHYRKAVQLEKILEDKQQELENIYKIYQNLQESFYENKVEEYHQSIIQENKVK
jgi:hypothetical protein